MKAFLIVLIEIIILGFVYVYTGNSLPDDFFHETSSLYFFSALLQSNAAIFAIVGVFIVFRLQSLQSSLDMLKNTLMQNRGKTITLCSVIEFDKLNIKEKEKKINFVDEVTTIDFLLQTWVEKEKKINMIKNSIGFPTGAIIVVLIFNIFGLVFSNFIHDKSVYLELSIQSAFIIIQIYIFLLLVKSINLLLDNRI
ncbi:MAG: hypothetical protein RAO94_13605 [Candidatus Stygibacter australis]|nr:hypothetical protein [Candidatus Stygibacter australis]